MIHSKSIKLLLSSLFLAVMALFILYMIKGLIELYAGSIVPGWQYLILYYHLGDLRYVTFIWYGISLWIVWLFLSQIKKNSMTNWAVIVQTGLTAFLLSPSVFVYPVYQDTIVKLLVPTQRGVPLVDSIVVPAWVAIIQVQDTSPALHYGIAAISMSLWQVLAIWSILLFGRTLWMMRRNHIMNRHEEGG